MTKIFVLTSKFQSQLFGRGPKNSTYFCFSPKEFRKQIIIISWRRELGGQLKPSE